MGSVHACYILECVGGKEDLLAGSEFRAHWTRVYAKRREPTFPELPLRTSLGQCLPVTPFYLHDSLTDEKVGAQRDQEARLSHDEPRSLRTVASLPGRKAPLSPSAAPQPAGEASVGGFRAGCIAGPEGPSLLTCLGAEAVLACAPSQVARAAFSSWQWRPNYRLQERRVDARGDCLQSPPRTKA